MASRRSSRAASALEQSVATPTARGSSSSGRISSSAISVPPLDDNALYEGWCRLGQPNSYRGPGDQERSDLAEGEGGRNFRRGVLARQDRLRKERQRLQRTEAQHAQQQQQHEQQQQQQRQLQSEQQQRELSERHVLLHQMREMLHCRGR